MADNINIDDIVSKVASQSAELEELKKAYQMTTNYPNSMQIEYTDDLKSKTFEKAPVLRFLESKGRVFDNNAALIGYYTESDSSSPTWISEDDDVPSATGETLTEATKKMSTIVAPIEVSMLSQKGNWFLDVLQRQIDKKFIQVNNETDRTLVEGNINGSSIDDSKSFDGLTKTITTHKEDIGGEPITESVIDDLLEELNDEGSSPDCIICSYGVAKQLKAIVAPYRRYNDKIDIGLGHRVISYESMDGTDIPILVDRNIDTTTTATSQTAGDKLIVVDSSSLQVRRLMPPTLITDLPTQKLGYRQVVAAFLTFISTGEWLNGQITGIGAGTTAADDGEH